jgi:hypothetical protein
MAHHSHHLMSILKRLAIAGPLFLIGIYLLSSAKMAGASVPQIIVALLLLVVGAVICAPAIAGLIADSFGSFFYPERKVEAAPTYSMAGSLLKKGLYQDAFNEYQRISEIHPEEKTPYMEMIKIALNHLEDKDLADGIYQKGRASLRRKGDKEALAGLFYTKRDKRRRSAGLDAFEEELKRLKE